MCSASRREASLRWERLLTRPGRSPALSARVLQRFALERCGHVRAPFSCDTQIMVSRARSPLGRGSPGFQTVIFTHECGCGISVGYFTHFAFTVNFTHYVKTKPDSGFTVKSRTLTFARCGRTSRGAPAPRSRALKFDPHLTELWAHTVPASRFSTLNASRPTPHGSRLTPHDSRLTPRGPRITDLSSRSPDLTVPSSRLLSRFPLASFPPAAARGCDDRHHLARNHASRLRAASSRRHAAVRATSRHLPWRQASG